MRALFNLKFLTFLVCVFMFYPCLSKWEKFREYNVFIEYSAIQLEIPISMPT